MNKNKECPEGKEINPKTGRCVKKCKEGEVRDKITGKCIKIKLKKRKECPEGKEINPKTGRCVKKCKEGEVRDKITGLCKKIKLKKRKECPEGKEINPKTGRCVNKCKEGEVRDKITGKCKKIKVKKSKESLKILNNKTITDLELVPTNTNRSSIFIGSPMSKNKYSLKNRLKLYNKAKFYLDKIDVKECLKTTKIDERRFMTLSKILFLDKRIGTKSVNGSIYLSSIKYITDLLLVSKVNNRIKCNLKEITIMNNLTDNLVKTQKTKHFPLIYSSHICEKKDKNNKKSLVSVNELCNGDLKMLLDDKSFYSTSEKTSSNIFFQIFISIATFQEYTNSVHNDCHYGNILYQVNTEEGYYKYQYNGNEFYLESCPYNMMLYDFGLTHNLQLFYDSTFFNDFYRILHAFIPEKEGGWNLHIKKSEFTENIIKIKEEIKNLLDSDKNYKFDKILKIIDPIIKDICKNVLDKDDILLNENPFIIN